MAEIITLVTSIDPLAPYKASDDLMLELVNVTATVEDDPEGAAAAPAGWRSSSPTPRRLYALRSPGPNDLLQKHGS